MKQPQTSGLPRRSLFGLTAGVAAASLAAAVPAQAAPARYVRADLEAPGAQVTPLSADQAWAKLVEGNRRFVRGKQKHPNESVKWRESLVNGQHPFALILGCADSRVPPELVFDEGLGQLFTVRSAGEVLDPAVIGSIEYGVEHLGIPLVVVLGHAQCGAVGAAIDLVRGTGEVAGDISSLVRAIEPAVRATSPSGDSNAFLAACVAAQAKRSAEVLLERSNIVAEAVHGHGVRVVPATYELKTGAMSAVN